MCKNTLMKNPLIKLIRQVPRFWYFRFRDKLQFSVTQLKNLRSFKGVTLDFDLDFQKSKSLQKMILGLIRFHYRTTRPNSIF